MGFIKGLLYENGEPCTNDTIAVACILLALILMIFSLSVTTIVLYMFFAYGLSWPHYVAFIQYTLGGGTLSGLIGGGMQMASRYVNFRYGSADGSPYFKNSGGVNICNGMNSSTGSAQQPPSFVGNMTSPPRV
jgi:uncharacterized integral membrane protein